MIAPPRTGAPAPALNLPTLDGGRLDLQDLRGHPAIITFLRHAG